MNNSVFLDYVENYNVDEVEKSLNEAFDILKVRNKFKPQMKVLVKVCLPSNQGADNAMTTHPAVVCAVVRILSKMGVSAIVADSPYGKCNISNLDNLYLNTGMLEVANLTTCELNHDLSTTYIETPEGKMTKGLRLLNVVNDVDAIINVGKIKIDERLGYVGACSNMFGLIPGELKNIILNRLNDYRDFYNYLIDIINAINDKLMLNILDGVVSLEAQNTPRMLSCIGVSESPYALDASILDILGIKYHNTILKQAKERDVFDIDKAYNLVGETIEKFKVEGFAINTFTEDTLFTKNKGKQKRYFNNYQKRVKIDPNICKGCGVCSKICPTGAISMKYDKNGELYAEVNFKKCIFCYKCHTSCPYEVVDIIEPSGYKRVHKDITKFDD